MAKVSITEAWLAGIAADEQRGKAAKLGGAARAKFWDNALPGFGVLVGQRFATFLVQHRIQGRQVLATIGRWGHPGAGDDHSDTWTVARARKEAIRLLGSMEQGVAPTSNRANSEALTLRDAFDAHIESLRKKVKGGKRSDATIATFEKSMRYVEHLLDKPIGDDLGPALVELHERIKRDARPRVGARNEKGAPLANRVIANVGTAWATLNRKLGGKLGTWNPAKSVEKDALVAKRVVLGVNGVADLADWFARVQTMRNPIQRDGLVFALFTGLRSEDVRTVRHEHVDLEARTLRLPDPKGGEARAFTIPLPATCIAILEQRMRDNARDLGLDDVDDGNGNVRRADDGWAFPALTSDGKTVGPIGDLRQQLHVPLLDATGAPVLDDDGAPKLRHTRFPAEDVHTLRRTYESVAQEAGISELDQHVLTNHSYGSHNVNATYIAQHIDHLAKCQAKIEAALERKLKPAPRPTHKPKARGHLKAVA